ncbi:hypothetical protein GCM10025771_24620 [Niveibacterium umoris]
MANSQASASSRKVAAAPRPGNHSAEMRIAPPAHTPGAIAPSVATSVTQQAKASQNAISPLRNREATKATHQGNSAMSRRVMDAVEAARRARLG